MGFADRAMATRIDRLLIGLFVGVAVCLNSCSAISTLKGFSWVCFPLAVLACAALLLMPDREGDKRALTIGVLVFSIPTLFSALANWSYSNAVNTAALLATILLAYLCARKEEPERLCKIFVSVMCVTSGLVNVAGLDLPLPVFENSNGVHYKTILFASQYVESYIQGSNSMGFFWEPGVFASYLLLAVAVELMVEEKVSKVRPALLIAALVTTGSTAGYLLLPLALSVGLLKCGGRGRVALSIGLLLVFLLTLVNYSAIIGALVKIDPTLFSKLTDADAVTRLTRLQSPAICWEMFMQNPVFGYGYGEGLDAYSAHIASTSTVDSLTTTSFFQLAAFGLLGLAMWAITAYGVLGTGQLPVAAGLMLLFLFAAILNKEPHIASALTYLLVFVFLALGDSRLVLHRSLKAGGCP